MKVYVEGNDQLLFDFFEEEGYELVNSVLDADLLCLEGGADVCPEWYGEENTHSTSSPATDYYSFGLLHLAHKHLGIPVVGICRGSQVMNVYNGGKMKQHINGHAGPDHLVPYKGKDYVVSSAHHQESIPADYVKEEDILRAYDGTVEGTIYRDKKMVGIQSHPEYKKKGHDNRILFRELLKEVM